MRRQGRDYEPLKDPDRKEYTGVGAFVPSVEQAKIERGERSEYRLKDGDARVSPDVERAFKSAGIKPMGAVRVQLASGELRQARWMDRIAQDSDVTSGRIRGVNKPLRGRFDSTVLAENSLMTTWK